MEIWLKYDKESIQIPILPPSFSVSMENGHSTVNVQTKGDVTIIGKKGLKSIDFESFFPNHNYPFASCKRKKNPYDYVKKIESWMEKAVRLTITGTNINMLCLIKSFSYEEPDGTGDIKYSISLEEYRPPTYKKAKTVTKKTTTKKKVTVKKTTKPSRPVKEAPKTYTVKSSDTLWGIAKNFYGSGSLYTKIYNANKSIIESTAKKHGLSSSSHSGVPGWWIYEGTKLVIPK